MREKGTNSQLENDSEMGSITDSDIHSANLADYLLQQQLNIGHQNALDWTPGQSVDGGESGVNDNQNKVLKLKIEALENKCSLLEEKLENMKLNRIIERENDKKQIDELKRDMLASQKKVEEAANEKIEKMEREMEESRRKMEEIMNEMGRMRQQQMRNNAANEHQAKHDMSGSQQKMNGQAEEGNKQWRLCNPKMNKWIVQAMATNARMTMTPAKISDDGLKAIYSERKMQHIFAQHPFCFTGGQNNNFGIQLNYYEVKTDNFDILIGLTGRQKLDPLITNYALNGYICYVRPFHDINSYYHNRGDQKNEKFDWPSNAIKPKLNWRGSNVIGCGLMIWPNNKMSFFFTANGTLLGKQIHYGVSGGSFYPAVTLVCSMTLEANFGDNGLTTFSYDIANCPGLDFDA